MKKIYVIVAILVAFIIGFLVYMNLIARDSKNLLEEEPPVLSLEKEEDYPEEVKEEPIQVVSNDPIVDDPTSEVVTVIEPKIVDGILVVNKEYPIPAGYATGEDADTRKSFEEMKVAALLENVKLQAFSTFRSNEYQASLYQRYIDKDGEEAANKYSAKPGHSEHETGLAMDIGEVGREDLWLTEEFGESIAGLWLAENAHHFGFILRYPKGKEHITGYMYESWHFRYLGVETATKVYESGLTLEEYLKL